ncbi:MAG TPA: alcohol dehydrogenase catalytic domain-containing protein [Propionibacteriaceae bacterium]|nr:alcohol dehydrogenase catalytic domain-containing protein [Propionibacteriaceae bacterium]
MTGFPATQHAVLITGVDQIEVVSDKPVGTPGPHQLLLQVEACGICFSDTKLLHAFDTHPRKTDVIAGLTPEELAEIPSYKPNSEPIVPGHEPVGRVVAVGDAVQNWSVGDRVLVQADWKHLKTARSNGSFGYSFEGALQEYVIIDERTVISPEGEKFLLSVEEGPSAAAVGLIEPWATVEAAYVSHERQSLKPGGSLLVVADDDTDTSSLDALVAKANPATITPCAPADVSGLGDQTFDDIVYFGADAEVISQLGDRLGLYSLLNVVLGGATIQGPVKVDVGRVHYDYIRYCGTTGDDAAEGYAWIPATGNLRTGDTVAIIGAAGPMGMMHTIRAISLVSEGIEVASVDATDLNDDRLAHLAAEVDPVSAKYGIAARYINTGTTPLETGYTYIACMVPVPAVVAQAVTLAGDGAIVNAFAGIPAGTYGEIDLQHLIAHHIYLLGTSGSDVSDMATVLRKIEAGVIDTTVSLDAITGIAGFKDAIQSVMDRTSGGKIMVYPQLADQGLVRLKDLAETLPHVAEKMVDGRWTKAAEDALLGR